MLTQTFPIVGMFYRPPAQAIINVLSIGTPLILMAEPDNPAHANAIAVFVHSKSLSEEAMTRLDGELGTLGFTLQQIVDQGHWQLGYVPRQMADALRNDGIVNIGDEIEGEFTLNPRGQPRVRIAGA